MVNDRLYSTLAVAKQHKLSYRRDSARRRSLRRSRSFKVTDLSINRKAVCDFLLVNNTNVNILSRTVFTALHGMQMRSSDENSVCLSVRRSVRLSNACFVTKWKKGRSRFLYHTKDHLAQFSEKKKEWLVGGDSLYLKLWVTYIYP